jgi:hypothetical protein
MRLTDVLASLFRRREPSYKHWECPVHGSVQADWLVSRAPDGYMFHDDCNHPLRALPR